MANQINFWLAILSEQFFSLYCMLYYDNTIYANQLCLWLWDRDTSKFAKVLANLKQLK